MIDSATAKAVNEVPSEYSTTNNSFTYTLDALGKPTSITLMTSVSITNGAPNGITGSYSIYDPVSGMIIHTEPFNIPDPIPIAKYVDLPVKTLTGSALQAILNKLGTQVLNGLLVIVKVAKPGAPLFVLAVDFLGPQPVGETIPDTFKRPQTAPYINCAPAIQTISSGESAAIIYTAGPEKLVQNVNVISSSSTSSQKLSGKKGVLSVKPTKDATFTFTANSESAPSSTQCIVNVIDKNKKPGQIEVTVDDRFINGYDINEYKNYWHYPVEYKIDGKLIGEVDYFNNMSTTPVTVTPDQNHTVTLTVNGKDVEDQTLLVPSAPPPISFSFTGGIWRHYRSAGTIPLILASMTLNTSEDGDLGKGTYFTDLSEVPDCVGGDKAYAIARLIRLLKLTDENGQSLITLNGNPITLKNPEPGNEIEVLGVPPLSNKFYKETSASYIDILFNSRTYNNLFKGDSTKQTLRRQYRYPSNNDFIFLNNENNIFDLGNFINYKDCR